MPSAGEKAIFAYFFWRLQKSMASGGTRPAGLDFNGGELLHVAGNFLPSAAWADINVGRFCWEEMKEREQVGACSFFQPPSAVAAWRFVACGGSGKQGKPRFSRVSSSRRMRAGVDLAPQGRPRKEANYPVLFSKFGHSAVHRNLASDSRLLEWVVNQRPTENHAGL